MSCRESELPSRSHPLTFLILVSAAVLGILTAAPAPPVFANIQNKGMRRFTLRGQKKVSAQWKLFTMVHNIEKVAGAARR